ncbi:hypothetical protein AAY80_046 [Stenotrophomonas phage vB_SmaS-DLP_6]|nr:hypothetical protein AAY80_046 [Stenotrophomonas phage vB_SmaS-DLP_6]
MYYGVTKFVVMKHGDTETPFVFPNHFIHADLGRRLPGQPVSAGFVFINSDMTITVRGRSESLNLDNRGEIDEKLIAEALCL